MSDRFTESGPLTLDTNVLNSVTVDFTTLSGSTTHDMYVIPASGAHTTHQVKINGSPDEGTTWLPMWTAVTGAGPASFLMDKKCMCPLLQVEVTVAEGAASTCNIYFFST